MRETKASMEAIWFIDLDDTATDMFIKISSTSMFFRLMKFWRWLECAKNLVGPHGEDHQRMAVGVALLSKGTNLSNKRLR